MKKRFMGLFCLVLLRATLMATETPFAVPPMLTFTSPTTAVVRWETESATATGALAFGKTRELGTVVPAVSDGMTHHAEVTGLEHGTSYHYKIAVTVDGKRRLSPAYEFTNVLNFSPSPVRGMWKDGEALAVLEMGGVLKGHAVVMPGHSAAFLLTLAANSDLQVTAVESEASQAEQLRRALYEQGAYGARVTVLQVEDLQALPLTACSVNLMVAKSDQKALMRFLTPGRGKLVMPDNVLTRPALDGMGEWTHQYGDSANTANSGETLSGARSTEDMTVQWLGHPGGDFGIDRNPRMPAPIAANGRLFHQGLNRMVALDAYNGSILWSQEIPDLRRVNIPRDSSNWCVRENRLFVAVRDRVWILDAGTGDRLATLPVPAEELSWGYVAHDEGVLFGSGVRPEAIYERYWGGDAWYDAKAGGLGTAMVCSDQLFAYDIATRSHAWTYQNGVILNPTIAVGQGSVVFLECRQAAVTSGEARQLNTQALWQDQVLVALDARTGAVQWEKPVDLEDGSLSAYLQLTEGGVLITTSNKAFHLYHYQLDDGSLRWQVDSDWADDHHSGHIQHPVVVNGKVFIQPRGFDLETGAVTTSNVGERSGCHTYVGASDCLIYRGENRQIAMWDQKEESVTSWTRLRPSCWLSVVPSNGMLLVPEGGAGCSCGGWMETSLVFAPKALLNLATIQD